MKIWNHKGWSVEAWLVSDEGIMVFDEQRLLEMVHFRPLLFTSGFI